MLALSTDSQGSRSTAVGCSALSSQNFTSATNTGNTAVGYKAGSSISTGINNTFIGTNQAGETGTDTDYNTAIGDKGIIY